MNYNHSLSPFPTCQDPHTITSTPCGALPRETRFWGSLLPTRILSPRAHLVSLASVARLAGSSKFTVAGMSWASGPLYDKFYDSLETILLAITSVPSGQIPLTISPCPFDLFGSLIINLGPLFLDSSSDCDNN